MNANTQRLRTIHMFKTTYDIIIWSTDHTRSNSCCLFSIFKQSDWSNIFHTSSVYHNNNHFVCTNIYVSGSGITVGFLFFTNADDILTTEPIGAMFYCLFFQMIGQTHSVQIILPIYQFMCGIWSTCFSMHHDFGLRCIWTVRLLYYLGC
jgi:hypothetical protein